MEVFKEELSTVYTHMHSSTSKKTPCFPAISFRCPLLTHAKPWRSKRRSRAWYIHTHSSIPEKHLASLHYLSGALF
jgi:hypothetical protein